MTWVWQKAPVFRILLPFVAGIILAWNAAQLPLLADNLIIAFALLGLTVGYIIFKRRIAFSQRWLIGLLLSGCFFVLGICFFQQARLDEQPDFFAKHLKDQDILQVRLLEPLQEKDDYYKATAEVQTLVHSNSAEKVSGKLLLYFSSDSASSVLKYGDIVYIHNKVQPLKPPQNPDEFDYSRYMAAFNVYHSAYVYDKDWKASGRNDVNRLWQFVFHIRQKLNSSIDIALPDKDEAGIAKALITGDVSDISPYLAASYSGTGTLHVLSVSGLHVGFIFWLISLALGFLDRGKKRRVLRIAIMLTALWLYALLTGLTPAVCRSAFMFSFVLIGNNLRRDAGVYNSIFTSAFFLLLFDPLMLFQVGFQMSYIALLAIVWLQPEIEKLWEPSGKWIKKFWQAVSVSLAAQIGTFILGFYYFNQFPIYFLPANLIIVPLSIGCLIAGIAFLGLYWIPVHWIQALAGKLLFAPVWLLNKTATVFNNLPLSHWNGVYLENYEAIILYLLIICVSLAFIRSRKQLWLPSMVMLLLFSSFRIVNEYKVYSRAELQMLAIPKQNVITIRQSNKLYVLADSAFLASEDQMKYHVQRYAWHSFVSPGDINKVVLDRKAIIAVPGICFKYPLGQFYDKRFLVISSKADLDCLGNIKPVDIVILSGNPKMSLADIYHKVHFTTVVAAANNSLSRIKDWETEAIENGIHFCNLQKDNSFAIKS
jgi:competence protein ComEC